MDVSELLGSVPASGIRCFNIPNHYFSCDESDRDFFFLKLVKIKNSGRCGTVTKAAAYQTTSHWAAVHVPAAPLPAQLLAVGLSASWETPTATWGVSQCLEDCSLSL